MASDRINTEQVLRDAFSKHRQGRLGEAQALYKSILRQDRNHFDALQLLGLCCYQANDPRAALEYLDRALSISRKVAPVFNHRGIVLRALGRNAEAIRDFDAALALQPDFADAHYNKGNALRLAGKLEEGRQHLEAAVRLNPGQPDFLNNLAGILSDLNQHEAALEHYRKIVALHPNQASVYLNLGLTLHKLRRTEEAIDIYTRAIGLNPRLAEAYSRRGDALREAGSLAEALQNCETAIRLDPGLAEAHCSRGNVLKELAQFEDALASFDMAIRQKPDYAEAFVNRGIVLKEMKRPDEALASLDRAIGLNPGDAEAHVSRGNVLTELERIEEALASFDAGLRLKPNHAEAHYNRGNALVRLKRFDDALTAFDRSIGLRPGYSEAVHNKALLLLRRQDYVEGFRLYASRWKSKDFVSKALPTDVPMWDGRSDIGRLLLWNEQGIGDEIFYSSFLSLIGGGVSVTLMADKRLHPVYRRSFPGISLLDPAIQNQHAGAAFDAQAPIGDLGHLLSVSEDRIRQRTYPFFVVNADRRQKIVAENECLQQKLVCGVAWSSANRRFGDDKTMRLGQLAPLLETPGMTFVNLQYGDVSEEIERVAASTGTRVHQAAGVDVFNDIDGLLSLIDACHIVLTTSNVTAHLAGAIGKRAAVLLPNGKGRLWYWHDQPQSIWYPSLSLFSQLNNGDWSDPVLKASNWIKDSVEWSV